MKPVVAQPRDLPTTCECGGKLVYDFGPGDYIAVACERCTPVVKVDLARLERAERRAKSDK